MSTDDQSLTLSVIIVNYNTRLLLKQTLQSLFRHAPSLPWEVIVVDNASSDGSASMVATEFPSVRVFEWPTNEGYGRAVNFSVSQATGDWLLLLNPDMEVSGGALDTLLDFSRRNPRAGVIGPRLLLPSGMPQPSARRFLSPGLVLLEGLRLNHLLPRRLRARVLLGTYFDQTRESRVPWISGACHLVPRPVWEKVGPLTEETFCGFDDYDYCYRATRAGFDVWLCPEAHMIHHCSVSVRQRWTSWEVEQLAIHNTYVVVSSHWPRWRVKALSIAELVTWGVEYLRHSLVPRREIAHMDEPYGSRLRRRLGLTARLLLGLEIPRRRFQPGFMRDQAPPSSD